MDQTTAELVTEKMGGGSVQWRWWTLADLTLLIAAYLIHSSSPTLNLFLLFQYFDPVSFELFKCMIVMMISKTFTSVSGMLVRRTYLRMY